MSKILVSGLINIETTLKVDAFPIDYAPVRYPFFGVQSTVAGVGYNISKALHTLGNEVWLCSLIGQDAAGERILQDFARAGLRTEYLQQAVEQSAQSVIIYDADGKRMIFTDLKDIQESAYPPDAFPTSGYDLAVLANINFSRASLARVTVPIATDVHALSSLDDEYNRDFMQHATILFLSHENLSDTPEAIAQQILNRFGCEIVVIGMGKHGALLTVRADNYMERHPAVMTRPVVNTIGAGDSLFSAFIHGYAAHGDPYRALQAAQVFASYKIGAVGAADGFLTARQLAEWIGKAHPL